MSLLHSPSLGSGLLLPASATLAAFLAEAAGLGTAAGEGTLLATFLAASAGFGALAGGDGSFSAVCFTALAALLVPAEEACWPGSVWRLKAELNAQ